MQELTLNQRLGAAPIDEPTLPIINLKGAVISDICRAIVGNLPTQPHALYRRGESTYVTIHISTMTANDGTTQPTVKVRPMTPNRLCTWLERYMVFAHGSGEDAKPTALNKQMAEKILACDIIQDAVPEIREIANVRLPRWHTDPATGKRTIRLAPAGYDAATRIYTATTLDYADELPTQFSPTVLRRVWANLVKDYPFRAEYPAEEQAGVSPITNRSACAALALMIGQYTRYLHARLPMAIINGNQPGTGKTLLAWMTLAVTWGVIPGSPCPQDDDEMTKVLNASVLEGAPFIVFDDIPKLASPIINMFATSPTIRGRILGTGTSFTAPNNCQIVATGNGLNTTPDVERRSLIIDLFCEENATTRQLATPTQKEAFSDLKWRAQMLTFCAALVANWAAKGCPFTTPATAKPSFETFAQVVGSILTANGFGDPFRPRITDGEGGDLIGRALEKLVAHIAGMMDTPTETYRIDKILEFCNELGYTETITNGKDAKKSLGRYLRRLRGRRLTDTKGRPFIFGKGEDSASSIYTLQLITPTQNTPTT